MLAKFFVGPGTDWTESANWSKASGGKGGAGIPTSYTDVELDQHSPNCVLPDGGAVDMKSLFVRQGYRGSMSGNDAVLNIFGNIEIESGAEDSFKMTDSTIKMREKISWWMQAQLRIARLLSLRINF